MPLNCHINAGLIVHRHRPGLLYVLFVIIKLAVADLRRTGFSSMYTYALTLMSSLCIVHTT